MSQSGDRDRRDLGGHRRGPPSNSELGERVARLEEKIDYISEAVDEVATNLSDEREELEEQVEENTRRVSRWWVVYQIIKYGLPVLAAAAPIFVFFLS